MEKVAHKLDVGLARLAIARIPGGQVDVLSQRTAARQLLTHLLAETYGGEARRWKIGRRTSGAPVIEGAGEAIEVSLSHSGGWVAAGFARGAAIGVDIEQVRPGRDTGKLAAYLGWDTPADDADSFYRRWTLWEALVKSRDGETRGPGVDAVLEGGSGVLRGFSEHPLDDVFCALVLQTPMPSNLDLTRLDPSAMPAWYRTGH